MSAGGRGPARRCPTGLGDDIAAVAEEVEGGNAERLRDLQRALQRKPFGIAAAAFAKIIEEMNRAPSDDCDLDPPGVRPRAAVEEDLDGRRGQVTGKIRHAPLYKKQADGRTLVSQS
ncbi:hypothetical protein GCM10022211_02240 [Sphingomonas humi]|uniref:Uncharacterized protein n=1 Tax=Sphingomonas humi TaxID=335630 RepID=A0ABP7RFI0_9SPHN